MILNGYCVILSTNAQIEKSDLKHQNIKTKELKKFVFTFYIL